MSKELGGLAGLALVAVGLGMAYYRLVLLALVIGLLGIIVFVFTTQKSRSRRRE